MGDLPVSVLLLARDETRDLEELIPSLAFAREVVVVWDPRGDAGTRSAAERLGARVFDRAWAGFGAQRAFALAQCRERWVLWIDADERLAPGAADALRGALSGEDASGYDLTRIGYFLGRRIRWCGWRNERVTRLFRREAARFDDAPVHERVEIEGKVAPLAATLEHRSYATWGECVAKMTRYASAGAHKARLAGRRAGALDVLLRPPLRFLRMYVLQLGVLDGGHGLALCLLAAAQVFLKYGELWLGRDPAERA